MKERIKEMKAATTAIDMTIFDLNLFSISNYPGSRCSSSVRSLIKKPPSKEKRKANRRIRDNRRIKDNRKKSHRNNRTNKRIKNRYEVMHQRKKSITNSIMPFGGFWKCTAVCM